MYGVTGKEEEPPIYRRSAIKVSLVISHLPSYSLERLESKLHYSQTSHL